MNLCKYSDILGVPNTGIHSYRVFNIAIIDVIFTIIAAFIIHVYFKINLVMCIIGLFFVGIFVHWIFCVPTTINKLLGLA